MEAYYIQVNVLCMILLLGVYTSLTGKNDFQPAKRVAYRRMILLALAMSVTDMGAWLCEGKDFPGAPWVTSVLNMVYYFSVTATCYAWLSYVDISLSKVNEERRKRRLLDALPFLAMTALILINPITGILFTVDENAVYDRNWGVIIHWVVSWMYLVVATGRTLYALKHTESRLEKESIRPMLWFIVMPIVAAITQMAAYGLTTLQCGITLSIVMIAFSMIREQVSSDSLTGLNNRRAFDNFMVEHLQKLPGRQYTIFFVDIDKFKSINDTYGHSTGDIALQRVATVLKQTCSTCGVSLFLCRYGGDEFVLVGANLKKEDTARVIDSMNTHLNSLNENLPQEMKLSLSIGTAEGPCNSEKEMESLIAIADQEMYVKKLKKGVAR